MQHRTQARVPRTGERIVRPRHRFIGLLHHVHGHTLSSREPRQHRLHLRPMNRSIWKRKLSAHSMPSWPCPSCAKGTLRLIPKSLVRNETLESKRGHRHPDWDPDWLEYAFVAWGKCSHENCGAEVAISGVGGIEPCYDADGGTAWEDYFSPRFCYPMPSIIDVPRKCPDDVKGELKSSFSLFFMDANAAANHVRVALERLMDHFGVQCRQKDKTKKFVDLSLHRRIEIFAKKQTAVGAPLMALKWLGNAASHGRAISQDDLLDAYEVLEHTLVELIDRRSERVAELVKHITKKHAPRKKRK